MVATRNRRAATNARGTIREPMELRKRIFELGGKGGVGVVSGWCVAERLRVPRRVGVVTAAATGTSAAATGKYAAARGQQIRSSSRPQVEFAHVLAARKLLDLVQNRFAVQEELVPDDAVRHEDQKRLAAVDAHGV